METKRTYKNTSRGVLQNHYITQEKFWGYRYVAPTFQDKYYGIPSSDLGIIATLKLMRNWALI